MYCGVCVDVSSSNVDQSFEYIVPSIYESLLKIGQRVKIPFGQSNREIMGYIIEIYDQKKYGDTTKEIKEVLDVEPLISLEQLDLAYKLKEDCICPLVRNLNIMIPEALVLKTVKYLNVTDVSLLDGELVDLFNGETSIVFNNKLLPFLSKIKKAISQGILSLSYKAEQKTNFKYVKKYSVDKDYFYQNRNSIRSENVLDFLNRYINDEIKTLVDIVSNYDISYYQVRSLVKKGFLTSKNTKVSRVKNKLEEESIINFDKHDSCILDETKRDLPICFKPSSKSDLDNNILEITKRTLENNKNILIICPEILSTIEYASLLRKTLHINVACINSLLSSGEYLDLYEEIKNEEYKVFVTSSKGIFLPYSNIGAIFMLDEDSDNYYNDQSPRYDVHNVVLHLKDRFNSLLIFESFSPSVNTFYKGILNEFENINHKIVEEKSVEVINLLEDYSIKNDNYISKRLKQAIGNSLNNKKRSLLIVNNKNSSSFVMCSSCGNVSKCEYCGLSLKYSEFFKALVCPSCGRKYPFNNTCSKCNSTDLIFGGCGMESINKAINRDFKDAKTIMLNSPSFKDYCSLYDDDFDADIIITNYACAKSLTSLNVSTIGIISLDSSIKAPRYDSLLKTYAMLTNLKISMNKDCSLFIQTYDVNHNLIKEFITGDYLSFLNVELNNRKLLKYEPYIRVNRIIVKGRTDAFKTAITIQKFIQTELNNRYACVGPSYSKSLSGYVLIIKHNNENINKIYKTIYDNYKNKDVIVIFDKYPKSL